mmetsp:Transcript_9321/g.16827  ORF Transcript_9321/g.16827 Transcript_9321/m.16827 type:complete len:583 (-) Transcript_9321:41-1789(-)
MQVGQPLAALGRNNLTFCAEVKSLQLRLAELRQGRTALPTAAGQCESPKVHVDRRTITAEGPPWTAHAENADVQVEAAQTMCASRDDSETQGRDSHTQEGLGGRSQSQQLAEALSVEERARARPKTVGVGAGGDPEGTFPSSPPRQPRRIGMASRRGACEMVGRPLPWSSGSAAHGSPRRPSQSLDSSLDQLKSENNRLTEQLVEASLESVQKFESFSNDRNALLQLAQDLRHQVHSEQAERTKCAAILSATQDALEALAAENVRITEEVLRSRPQPSVDGVSASRSADLAPQLQASEETPCLGSARHCPEVPDQDSGQLRQELMRKTEEAMKLRQLIHEQTSKANATILDMARRNVNLEKQLQEAMQGRSQAAHRAAGHDGTPLAPWQISKAATQLRSMLDPSVVSARSQGSARTFDQDRRSLALGAPRGLRRVHSTGSSARALLSERQPRLRSASTGGPTLSGHTTPHRSPVWPPSAAQPGQALQKQPSTASELQRDGSANATPASRQRSRSSPRLSPSPSLGGEGRSALPGRYTGRRVPPVSRTQAPARHPIFKLEQSLDQAAAEMRRMQQQALLAAAA